ncbi:hypothetical protein Acr_00g0032170 [Actinidia rufa]|uniref:Uncharacterized protein n=1 Tax=Actinidia rufa TaxID=165716 RepID=A0A7J0DFV3_9ERIC|nr:hypothetical protein Acr_00g0032170 [Actinidia rufa]
MTSSYVRKDGVIAETLDLKIAIKLSFKEVNGQVLQLEVRGGDGGVNDVSCGVAGGVAAASSTSGDASPCSDHDPGGVDTFGVFSFT